MSIYSQIQLSDTTKNKRKQIKSLMDQFMDFQWRGCSAFEKFGVFILNSKKGDLKFYNGPGFSNEYSKPQFSTNGGDLIGVNFSKQTISFSIGVYWISIEDYRKLINWLHPLVVDYIIFDFEPNFRYNVKLSKVGDSSRMVVGKEKVLKTKINTLTNTKETYYENEPRYYTELSLTFELQGEPCAKGVHSYELVEKGGIYNTWGLKTNINDFRPSDLDTPFEFDVEIPLVDNEPNKKIQDQLSFTVSDGSVTKELYNIEFSNLQYTTSANTSDIIHIKYNSESGLLFLQYGASYERILTQLTTIDTGDRIVSAFSVNKFYLPGLFSYPDFDYEDLIFKLNWSRLKDGERVVDNVNLRVTTANLISYPRTNVI